MDNHWSFFFDMIPSLVNVYITMERFTIFNGKITIFNGKIHYFYGIGLDLPSGKRLHNELERSTIFYGKTYYKWPFSIAMLNYQRVNNGLSVCLSVRPSVRLSVGLSVILIWLVVSTHLEKFESQLGRIIPNILWENKKCSKPPTSSVILM